MNATPAASQWATQAQPPPTAFMSGFFGALNVGDEAVCLAVAEGLRAESPGSLAIVTRNPRVTREFTGLDANLVEGFYPTPAFWWNLRKYVTRLAHSERVVIGGGGILQDVHSWTTVVTHLLPGALGIAFGRPVVTVGLGVGPIQARWLRWLTGAVCRRMSLVQVRNPRSREELVACGVPAERIHLTSDVVPALDLKEHAHPRASELARVIGFGLRRWDGLNETGVVALWNEIAARGCRLKLLTYEPSGDRPFYEELLARCSPECRAQSEIHIPTKLHESIEALASVDALVAMRLHACVFAALVGAPFLALSYHHKVQQFVEELGLSHNLRSLEGVDSSWADEILDLPRRCTMATAEVAKNLDQIRDRASENMAAASRATASYSIADRWTGAALSVLILFIGALALVIRIPLALGRRAMRLLRPTNEVR